jgi:outer membrane lipoprotein SlyB
MAREVTYEAGLIQEFAQRLYRQAGSIILSSTLLGLFGGALVGGVGSALVKAQAHIVIAVIIGAAIGGFWGFARGKERAFKLKLEAQVALCQLQIEKNTKK